MTTYKTGNPIGSTSPKDLYDNSQNMDEATNSLNKDYWDDRLGRKRLTWEGMTRLSNLGAAVSAAERAEAAADIAEHTADMRTYFTKAEADAALPMPSGTVIRVTNDPDANKNGYWVSDGAQWVWSGVQPSSRTETETLVANVRIPAQATASEVASIRTVTDNLAIVGIPGFLYAILSQKSPNSDLAKLLLSIRDTGVAYIPKLEADELKAPGLPITVPGTAWAWADVDRTDHQGNARVMRGIDREGRGYAYVPGRGFVKVFDQTQVDEIASKMVERTAPLPLTRLVDRLMNPLEDVNCVYIGDSTTWGLNVAGNSPSGPRPDGPRLTNPRDNLLTGSFVNRLRTWLGQSFMQIPEGAVATEEAAPGALAGGSGYFVDPYQAVEVRHSTYVEVLDGQDRAQEKLGHAVVGATVDDPLIVPAGCVVRFTIRGEGCTVIYGTSVNGGQCRVYVDGVDVGVIDTQGDPSWGNEHFVATTNAVHEIRIANPSGVDLRIEQIRRVKVFRLVNQGLVGSGSGNWVPGNSRQLIENCLPPAASDVIVRLGANDRAVEVEPRNVWRVKNNHRLIGEYLESLGCTVTLQSQLGISLDYPDNSAMYFSLLQMSRAKRELCEEKGWSFLDGYARNVSRRIDGEWGQGTSTDGNHHNEVGHGWILDSITSSIQQFL